MSALREQISTRLLMAFGEGRARVAKPEEGGGVAINVVEVWNYVADECIRQMEWSAYRATLSHRESEGYDDKADALAASKDFVTAAPDDWRPSNG